MDIEKLNKTQIVLLTLLISFVTSIATGIVTITLMDQAPPAVIQTIHKVVERTVETVTPKTQQMATVNKEVVVVKEQNVIADVVENNIKTFVRIKHITKKSNNLISFGIIVDKSGIIITGSKNIVKDTIYNTVIDSKNVDLVVVKIDQDKKVAYLKVKNQKDDILKSLFPTANLVESDSLKLGQVVITLGGVDSTEIYTGIISGFSKKEPILGKEEKTENTSATPVISVPQITSIITASQNTYSDTDTNKINLVGVNYTLGVKTNIPTQNILEGEPLLDLQGDVVGINVDSDSNSFIFLNFVKDEISEIVKLKGIEINKVD